MPSTWSTAQPFSKRFTSGARLSIRGSSSFTPSLLGCMWVMIVLGLPLECNKEILWGPFSLLLPYTPLILRVQEHCNLPFHAWYLDDGTIIGNTTEVAKALDIINMHRPSLGLHLN